MRVALTQVAGFLFPLCGWDVVDELYQGFETMCQRYEELSTNISFNDLHVRNFDYSLYLTLRDLWACFLRINTRGWLKISTQFEPESHAIQEPHDYEC